MHKSEYIRETDQWVGVANDKIESAVSVLESALRDPCANRDHLVEAAIAVLGESQNLLTDAMRSLEKVEGAQ
jgi:hypothetical protein